MRNLVLILVVLLCCGEAGAAPQKPFVFPFADGPSPRDERLAQELQERRDRQLAAGLTEDAAKTSLQLQALIQAQVQKCGAVWTATDSLKRGVIPKKIPKTNQIVECMWRPGEPPPQRSRLPGLPASPTHVEEVQTRVATEAEGATRPPMFLEPMLFTSSFDLNSSPALVRHWQEVQALVPELLQLLRSRPLSANLTADAQLQQMIVKVQQTAGAPSDLVALLFDMRRLFATVHGDFAAALDHSRAATRELEQSVGAASPMLCPSLWETTSLLVSARQFDLAMETARRCLSLAAPQPATYAAALNNVGVIEQRTGAFDRAIDVYGKSLTAFDRVALLPQVRAIQPQMTIHANLGLAHWQAGHLADAHRHLRIARELMVKEAGSFTTERGAVGALAALSNELDVFLTLEGAAQGVAGETLALPMLLERKGYGLAAKTATVKALSSNPRRLLEYRALLASRAALARAPAADAAEREAQGSRQREIDQQIQTLEVEASQPDSLAAFSAQTSDPRAGQWAKAFTDAVERREKEYYKHRPKNDYSIDQETLNEISSQAEAEIAPKFRDVFETQAQKSRGSREALLPDIQRKLPESAALIEMVRFRPFHVGAAMESERWAPARYGAYVIRRTGTPVFVELGDAATIETLVVEFRRTLSVPRGTLAHDLGRRLDAALMDPIRARIGTSTEVYLSPDGLLNLVPFGALVDDLDRFLVETFTFNYVSSGRDLLRDESGPPLRRGPPAVIADPAFDGRTNYQSVSATSPLRSPVDTRYEALPATAAEAQAIKAVLPGAVVFRGDDATETALKGVAAPRILHIATHGFFLADQDLSTTAGGASASLEDPMLRSGLVFAGANAGGSGTDDGVLTALEASVLGLRGTELVVLSACETGVGDVKTGEGVFGLRRAFMAAGTETLVMSLWRVDDDATRQLMVEFYRRLARGDGRAEALRQASLTLLRDPARRHPFYWASFIATGDPGPLHP
ncbi:MAG: CHAT domain-containing tetratricopeptide repeat protein [Vicinamibacterales bacterium]